MNETATLARSGKKAGRPYAALPAPTLSAPTAGAPVDGSAAVFAWESLPGATAYWLQIADDPAFQSLRFDAPVGEATSLTLYASLPEDGSTFYWRLRAGDGTDWHAWSAPAVFAAVGVETFARHQAAQVAVPAPPPAAAPADAPLAPHRTGTTGRGDVLLFILLFVLTIAALAFAIVYLGGGTDAGAPVTALAS